MDNFDILSFDPLSPRTADTYVQSVMESTKLNKVSTTIAEIHPEKTVSDFNCTLNESTPRNKSRLSNETMGGKTKKLKAKADNHDDEIIRLSQFTQCKDTLNDTSDQNSDDIGELKSLVVGLTGTMNSFCNVIT